MRELDNPVNYSNGLGCAPRGALVGLGAQERARSYFVTLRRFASRDERAKCAEASSDIDPYFVAMIATDATSPESACGEAMADYLSDNPGQRLVARAFSR